VSGQDKGDEMKLAEYFRREHIIAAMTASTKQSAVKELIQKLVASGCLPKSESAKALRAIMRREELGTTGIGNGVAVPHAKYAGMSGCVCALGRSVEGIEFDALDGRPVHLLFLIVSSPDAAAPHLAMLKKVTAVLRDDVFCTFLKRAKDEDELVELLCEAEERLAKS